MRAHQALVIRINEAQELFLGPVDSVQGVKRAGLAQAFWLVRAGLDVPASRLRSCEPARHLDH